MLNKMESKENFYFVHLAKELDLIKCANNNTCISLIPLHSCSITCDVISKKYHITYKNMFFFDFKLITTREPIKTSIVKQNTIICEINTEETINNLIRVALVVLMVLIFGGAAYLLFRYAIYPWIQSLG